MRIQETQAELPRGSIPRSVEVILRAEAVETAQAGDRCDFTGTLIVVPDVSAMALAGSVLFFFLLMQYRFYKMCRVCLKLMGLSLLYEKTKQKGSHLPTCSIFNHVGIFLIFIGTRAETSSRVTGKEGFEADGIQGLKALGVRELSYRLAFLANHVAPTNPRVRHTL